jgi:hypothetical protein
MVKAIDKAVIAAEHATVDKLEAEALIETVGGARVAGKRIDEDQLHGDALRHLQSYPPDYTTANSERRSFAVGFAALSHASHSMRSNYGLSAHCLPEDGGHANQLS